MEGESGKKAPFQSVPTYLELVIEINNLKQVLLKANERIKELEEKLDEMHQDS